MTYVSSSQMLIPSTACYRVADCVLQIHADSEQSAAIWQTAGSKYQMAELSTGLALDVSGTVEIYSQAIPPSIPNDWEMEFIEHGASFTNGKQLWLAVADSLIALNALPVNRVQIWIGCTTFARSAEGLDILLAYALPAILHCRNRFEIHAAGLIAPNSEQGILVLGDSGSGKSTLTVRLVQSGWQYLSDDLMLLREQGQGVVAWGLRCVFALTDQTLHFCLPNVAAQIAARRDEDKHYVSPCDLFAMNGALSTKPAALFFTRLTYEARSSIEPLAPSESMLQLIRQSPWLCYDPRTAHVHTEVLKALSTQCRAYQLNAGRDLLLEPERADHLLKPYLL